MRVADAARDGGTVFGMATGEDDAPGPAMASLRALALPGPFVAPVMTQTLPSIRFMDFPPYRPSRSALGQA